MRHPLSFYTAMNTSKKVYRQPRYFHGWIIFLLTIILFLLLGAPMQLLFGIYGLAASEFLLLLCAIFSRAILRYDPLQTFPMALPQPEKLWGAFLIYLGAYAGNLSVLTLTDYFFPEDLGAFTDTITSYTADVPPAMAILCIAFLPAVCEEALHRGVLLHCFRKRGLAAAVLTGGVVFGLFHLDPSRFLSTAMMGAAFAYIAIRTDSLVPTMLFHFLTNLLSVYSLYAFSAEELTQSTALASPVFDVYGICCMYFAAMFLLLLFGLRHIEPRCKERPPIWAAVAGNGFLLVGVTLYLIQLYA